MATTKDETAGAKYMIKTDIWLKARTEYGNNTVYVVIICTFHFKDCGYGYCIAVAYNWQR